MLVCWSHRSWHRAHLKWAVVPPAKLPSICVQETGFPGRGAQVLVLLRGINDAQGATTLTEELRYPRPHLALLKPLLCRCRSLLVSCTWLMAPRWPYGAHRRGQSQMGQMGALTPCSPSLKPSLGAIQQPQGCNASWSASLGAGWFLRCAERRWLLQPTHAVKEPPGNLQPTAALLRNSGTAASLTAMTILSADSWTGGVGIERWGKKRNLPPPQVSWLGIIGKECLRQKLKSVYMCWRQQCKLQSLI